MCDVLGGPQLCDERLLSAVVLRVILFSLQGLGTDDRALIRIMVSRSEIDLFNIRKDFKETHDTSLHDVIQVETLVVSVPLLVSLCQRPVARAAYV